MRKSFGFLLPMLLISTAASAFGSYGAPPPPPPPLTGPGYQLGNYPWVSQLPFDGRPATDVRRMAYMAYEFNEDMQEFMQQGMQPPQMRELAQAINLLAHEAYDLDQEAQHNPYNMQTWLDEYFALVSVFTNIGHMLASVAHVAPMQMLQEWNDVDFCMSRVDMQMARLSMGSMPSTWNVGRFINGVWSHVFWGPSWWGYRHAGWRHGRWGHPGWGWTGGWRRPHWGPGGWRHPGFGWGGRRGGGGWHHGGPGRGPGRGPGGGWHHGSPR